MNRSARRVLPSSSPSTNNLRSDAVGPSSDHPPSARVASRLRSAGDDGAAPDARASGALPGVLVDDVGRASPTARAQGAGPRRNSMRRAPIQAVFPESYDERTASGKLKRGRSERAKPSTSPRASLLRHASLTEMIGEDYLRKLRVLFDICDGDGNGALTRRELLVLLELMGFDAKEAQDATAMYAPDEAATTSFDELASAFRVPLVMCAACNALPRDDFVLRCKRLKYGFRKIDGDRNQGMTRAELEIAIQKLDLAFGDDELDRVFAILDRAQTDSVEWCDFVYSAYHNTLAEAVAATGTFFTIDMFADLPSFIRQASGMSAPSASSVPTTSAAEAPPMGARYERRLSQRMLSFASRRASFVERSSSATSQFHRESTTKSTIERIGIEYLKRTSMEHLAQTKKTTMTSRRFDNEASAVIYPGGSSPTRRAGALRTGFSVHVRRRIRLIEWTAVCIGALAGIVCGLISTGFETLLDENHSTTYYVYLMLINIAVSIIEVHGMYLTAVIAAFRLTVTTNLKLYPQDAEREFLTRAIARAALQVGHRKERLFGIDPMKDSPRVVLCMSFMVYRTKRYAVKLLFKLLIKRVVWRAAAKSVLSLLVLPINGIMNAWTILNVMLNCRVSIIGPPCVVSLLETFFLQDDLITPAQRVDYVRILGVSLVCKRCIHPNVEIMIEHMRRQWLKPGLWPVVDGCRCLELTDDPCPRHVLDDLEDLLALLRLYAAQAHGPTGATIVQHRRNMFFFFIVALIIDGSVDWIERSLFVRLCNAANLQNSWSGVLRIKDDFIAGKGIHTDAVMALIQELPAEQQGRDDQLRVPWRESALYSAQRIAQLLVW